jgi:hypothetical protein
MKEFVELMPDTKQCPICSQDLPLTEYGICRARKDGRNLYCKSCIRKKVSESRKAFKAYKSVRHQYVVEKLDDEHGNANVPRRQGVMRQVSKMTPVERVRESIKSGARTQKEIGKRANLGTDEVCEALANLLLWTREVRTEIVGGERHYVINQPSPEIELHQREVPAPQVPPRKRDVPSSFSAVQDIMPGKKPEDAPVRAPGWVAA